MKSNRVALIIDDEKQIRRLLRLALEGADHQVYEAETGKGGLAEIVYRRPDIVLLDLGLPDMEGVKVLRNLREWSDVPVLILSVRDDAEEKVAALDAGADDYVTKPFDTAELLARVRAAQRRSLKETGEPIFQSGSLCVDFSARQVKLDGKEIKLTPTEYSLLRALVQNAGKVVTHRQLLRTVWGEKAESPGAISAGLRHAPAKKTRSRRKRADPHQDRSRYRLSIIEREPLVDAILPPPLTIF
jgi:two-component system KDP operon response regulator KdpE